MIPLERLGRPRIDVTLRISGFFRDAFPHLITLVDRAVELVVALDEPPDQNFPRKHYLAEARAADGGCARRGRGAGALSHLRREAGHLRRGHPAADRNAPLADRPATSRRSSSNGAATPTAASADGVDARDVFADRLRTDRGRRAQPGQSRARHLRFRRLLPVPRRDDRDRAIADRAGSRRPTSATARARTRRRCATCAKRRCASTALAS